MENLINMDDLWVALWLRKPPFLASKIWIHLYSIMFFSMERDIPYRDTPRTFLFIHLIHVNSKYFNFIPNNYFLFIPKNNFHWWFLRLFQLNWLFQDLLWFFGFFSELFLYPYFSLFLCFWDGFLFLVLVFLHFFEFVLIRFICFSNIILRDFS